MSAENPIEQQGSFESRLCDRGRPLLMQFKMELVKVKARMKLEKVMLGKEEGFKDSMDTSRALEPWKQHIEGCPQCKAAVDAENAKAKTPDNK